MKNNLFREYYINVTIASLISIFLFTFNKISAQNKRNSLPQKIQIPYEWHFSGHFGQYIDAISEKRIINKDNWNKIYSETEEAFRLREDDKNYPISGFWAGEFWGKYILSVIAASHYYQSD